MAESKCPVCKSQEKANITASGGEWVSLRLEGEGAVRLFACVNCGCVYLDGSYRIPIKRRIEQAKERRRQWLNT